MPNHPSQVLKQGQLADRLQRDFIQSVASTGRRARNMPTGSLMVTGRMNKVGHWNPVVTRQLGIVVRTIATLPGKGNKPNRQFLYDLAMWLTSRWRAGLPTPCRSLAKYKDQELLCVLQRHGKVEATVLSWDDIPTATLRGLEKRLYHHWKSVESLALALKSPTDHASNSRRKKKNPTQHMASQLMARPNS